MYAWKYVIIRIGRLKTFYRIYKEIASAECIIINSQRLTVRENGIDYKAGGHSYVKKNTKSYEFFAVRKQKKCVYYCDVAKP